MLIMSTYQDIDAFSNSDNMDENRKKKTIQDKKKKSDPARSGKDPDEESDPLTDKSGEEKKEHYINTDERRKDLRQRGL